MIFFKKSLFLHTELWSELESQKNHNDWGTWVVALITVLFSCSLIHDILLIYANAKWISHAWIHDNWCSFTIKCEVDHKNNLKSFWSSSTLCCFISLFSPVLIVCPALIGFMCVVNLPVCVWWCLSALLVAGCVTFHAFVLLILITNGDKDRRKLPPATPKWIQHHERCHLTQVMSSRATVSIVDLWWRVKKI